MNQLAECFTSGPPSKKVKLLKSIIGDVIAEVTRHSWLAPQAAISQYNLQPRDVVSLTAGPLSLTFSSGIIAAFASDPALASVICWTERDAEGNWRDERLDQDGELFPVSGSDDRYSSASIKGIVGETLVGITIWKRPPVNHKWDELPREVAIQLAFAGGKDIWLTHGLHDNSDDFSVLEESQIVKQLRVSLIEPNAVE